MLQFSCPYCTASVKVPDSASGKLGACPKCGTKIRIPSVPVPPVAPKAPQQTMPEPLSISCPNCGSGLKIKDYSLIGKKVPCPKCKVPFQIAVRVEAALVDVPVEPDEADLWEETRLWKCRWCDKECQIPAEEPDPVCCEKCRANVPRPKPSPRNQTAASQPPKKSFLSKRETLLIAFGSFLLLLFACCLLPTGGHNGSTSPSPKPFKNFPSVGDKVKITVQMWLSVDETAQANSLRLSTAKDELGLEEMEMRGRIFVVPAGTEGILLEGGVFSSRVRITSGEHSGKAGYISSEFVSKK